MPLIPISPKFYCSLIYLFSGVVFYAFKTQDGGFPLYLHSKQAWKDPFILVSYQIHIFLTPQLKYCNYIYLKITIGYFLVLFMPMLKYQTMY